MLGIEDIPGNNISLIAAILEQDPNSQLLIINVINAMKKCRKL